FYEAALRVLGRHGHRRRRDQSPREFLDSVRERRGEAIRPFVSITKTFEGARYGHRDVTAEERARLLREAEELSARLAAPPDEPSV
ncbi:MAG: DUF4129 domain-containing protein, partial [Planctomycetota bacterium]